MPRPWKTSLVIAVSFDALRLQNMQSFTEPYKNQVNLVLCIFGSDKNDLKLDLLVGSISLGKGQEVFKIKPVDLKSRLPRTSVKGISTGVEHSSCPKPQHIN